MNANGNPVLLKHGYLKRKTVIGWERKYFRLLEDALFMFVSHTNNIPQQDVSLLGGSVEDVSWKLKKNCCILVQTEKDGKIYLNCENNTEFKEWYDALYFATTVSKLAEYCSPLTGGWLFYKSKQARQKPMWARKWFVIEDTFLVCYEKREDANPLLNSGEDLKKVFVLPLSGAVIAYHKTDKYYSFSIQMYSHGELQNETVLAAESEAIMNVWMEVLYVSTGREVPGLTLDNEDDNSKLLTDFSLESLSAEPTPTPSRSHNRFSRGNGIVNTRFSDYPGRITTLLSSPPLSPSLFSHLSLLVLV
mmetsp:Transcript_39793/g.124998  ORF Transcript_39793/g.124998 Transcript_39793/m.124998 type:complete len:305 (-) Transcript_39793:295-1209(-)